MSLKTIFRYKTFLLVGSVCFLLPVSLFFLVQILFSCPYTVGVDDHLSSFFGVIGEPALGIILITGLLSTFLTVPLYIKQKGYSGLRVITMTFILWMLMLGLLSLYLASMNSSRDKGSEAHVRASLSNVSADIERAYTEDKKFGEAGGDCSSWTTAPHVRDSLSAISKTPIATQRTGLFCADPDIETAREVRCYADTESYAITTQIWEVSGLGFYCIDSNGYSGERSTPITGPSCEE